MPIENRTTTYNAGGFIWIPNNPSTAIYKITVTRSDGTIDDLTNLAHIFEIEDGVTENIGRFEFEIWDPNETYKNAWDIMNIFKYYSDYGTIANTLRFRGRITKISYQNNKLKVIGQGEALKFNKITVTQQYSNQSCSSILTSLVTIYGSGFTTTNVNTPSTNITVNWYQKPFWEAVNELCTNAGFDVYIDANLDFHFFESGSILNDNEAIIHEQNLIEVGEYIPKDADLIKNRIIIYGAEVDGIQELYTSEDTSSQNSYFISEDIISNDNVTNSTQAQQLGDALKNKNKLPPTVGEIKSTLLASIQPGEKIWISSPYDKVEPDNYLIISYKHSFNDKGLFTSVKVSKEPRKISHIIKELTNKTKELQQTSLNPYEMRYSYNFLFNSDSGTHTNTLISNGVLKATSATANWVSPVLSTSSTITQAYLIVIGNGLSTVSYQISANDGVNYETITNKNKIIFANQGTSLKIKVVFTDTTAEIDSLSILYKY